MARKYQNFISGTLSSGISSTDTSFSSTGLTAMMAISSPDVMYVIFDPGGVGGAPEIVHIAAHSTSSATATVTRAQQGTSGRAHNASTPWVAGITTTDLARLDTIETDGWVTTGRLSDGSVTAAKIGVGAVVAGKIAAGAVNVSNMFGAGVVDASALASDAVSTIKIADGAVTSAKLNASAAIAQTQLAALPTGRWTAASQAAVGGVNLNLIWTAETEDDLSLAAPSWTTWTVPSTGLWSIRTTTLPTTSLQAGTTPGWVAVVVNGTIYHHQVLIDSTSVSVGLSWTLPLTASDTVVITVRSQQANNITSSLVITKLGSQ